MALPRKDSRLPAGKVTWGNSRREFTVDKIIPGGKRGKEILIGDMRPWRQRQEEQTGSGREPGRMNKSGSEKGETAWLGKKVSLGRDRKNIHTHSLPGCSHGSHPFPWSLACGPAHTWRRF